MRLFSSVRPASSTIDLKGGWCYLLPTATVEVTEDGCKIELQLGEITRLTYHGKGVTAEGVLAVFESTKIDPLGSGTSRHLSQAETIDYLAAAEAFPRLML